MPRDDIEHGWLVAKDSHEYIEPEPERVGRCAWCDEPIYEDEEYYTYGYNEAGELLCWKCLEESKNHGLN